MRMLTAALVAAVVALVAASRLSAQAVDKAAEIIASSRKAIGAKKLDEMKTLGVEASVQRNLGQVQLTSDVEMLLELPDKYVRTDQNNGPGVVVMSGMNTGFNGDRPLNPVQGSPGPGGGMFIRMGPGGPLPNDGPKPTPEERERLEKMVVRSARHELSRLMLGWFAAAHPSVAAQYSFAGEAESPDGRAYVIDTKSSDGFEARLFVDLQSNLPLMVTYRGPQRQVMTAGGPHRQVENVRPQPPAMVDYTIYFDDWRTVDGVRFPHKMRRAMAGETTEEWTVTRVRINPTIDPRKFAVKDGDQ